MYAFFRGYDGCGAPPSFSKFAGSIGVTLKNLESLRVKKKFDEAYRECSEIRRDYLIDGALTKRYDSSFTKFLLNSEFGMGDEELDEALTVRLEVVE